MSRLVKDIVRSFLNDDTVKEKKPFEPLPPEPARTRDNPPPQGKTFGTRAEREALRFGPESDSWEDRGWPASHGADGECSFADDRKHQWAWTKGVKRCWLCDELAPVEDE